MPETESVCDCRKFQKCYLKACTSSFTSAVSSQKGCSKIPIGKVISTKIVPIDVTSLRCHKMLLNCWISDEYIRVFSYVYCYLYKNNKIRYYYYYYFDQASFYGTEQL